MTCGNTRLPPFDPLLSWLLFHAAPNNQTHNHPDQQTEKTGPAECAQRFNPPAPCFTGELGRAETRGSILAWFWPPKSPPVALRIPPDPPSYSQPCRPFFMPFFHSFLGARKITKNMNSVPHGATQKATKTVLLALWSHYKKQRLSRCCFLVITLKRCTVYQNRRSHLLLKKNVNSKTVANMTPPGTPESSSNYKNLEKNYLQHDTKNEQQHITKITNKIPIFVPKDVFSVFLNNFVSYWAWGSEDP